jgi:hypothetical protein
MRNLALIIIAAIAILSTVVYASSVSVATPTYQAQNGVYYVVTGNLGVTGQGFTVGQTTSESSQPCQWSNKGTCTTAVTGGDWVYTVQVALTTNTPASSTFTVTLQWLPQGGTAYVTVGTLQFTTLSTITPGQTMNFTFDTGSKLFTAPVAIVITVQ